MSPDNTLLQQVLIRVDEMRDALTALEASLNERCPQHHERLERIETILAGPPDNGKRPGLCARVNRNEDAIKRIQAVRTWVWGVAGTVAGTGIGAVLGLLANRLI